jgi:hypothetical protein
MTPIAAANPACLPRAVTKAAASTAGSHAALATHANNGMHR